MRKSWRFIPSFKALAAAIGACAVLGLCSGAWAQSDIAGDPGAVKKYVLMADGGWGAAQDAAIARVGGTVDFSHAASGIGFASSPDPLFLRAALRSGVFARGAEDMMVQWQMPVEAQLLDEGLEEQTVTPGDDNFINLLWNMTAIDAPGAWALGYDGSGVRVAVIDGGTCSAHPDLAANIDVAASASFVPGFNYDQETGGLASFRHACHVAGIIAAVDNTIGTIGVAPKATIIALKALHGGSGSFAAVIGAILYAADPISEGGAGADIINMSLGATFAKGGGPGTGALISAVNQAVNYANDRNVLVVSAAGNNGFDLDHMGSITTIPAQSGSGIAVSATAPFGFAVNWPNGATNFRDPASYSNYGHSVVWVSAPGGDGDYVPAGQVCAIPRVVGAPVVTNCFVFDFVLSPGSQGGSYFFAFGTSMAAPHVSGVAALVKQKYPGILVGDLKAALAQTADDVGGGGSDPFHGQGAVNAHRAVVESGQQMAANPTPKVDALGTAATRVELVIGRNAGRTLPEISFTLPAAGPARIELFDVAGRKVAVLFSGNASAGRTTLAWNGRDSFGRELGQGAYFARLAANGVTTSRQIVLLGQ